MNDTDPSKLPIHPTQAGATDDDETPACSPKIYVSNEEASLLRQIRHLHDRSLELRREIAEAPPARQRQLEAEIVELRRSHQELVLRREQAYRRKMVMLGHLPPEALEEEIIL